MPNTILEIDLLNKLSWDTKFENHNLALDYAKTALGKSKKAKYTKGVMYARLHIAVCMFLLSENMDKVQDEFEEAYEYFNSSAHYKGFIISCNYLAQIFDMQANFEKGFEYCEKALNLSREMQYKEYEADALVTHGNLFRRLNDFEKALEQYKMSANIREELDNRKALAASLNIIARTHCMMKDFENSLNYYYKTLALKQEIKDPSIIYTSIGIASVFEEKGDLEQAKDMYDKCIESKEINEEKVALFLAYQGIGRINMIQKKYNQAIGFFNKTLVLVEELKISTKICEVHLSLSDCYLALNEIEKAFEFYKSGIKLKQEITQGEIMMLKNIKLKNAYQKIEEKSKMLNESIVAAKYIQQSMLPPTKFIKGLFEDFFIIYLPKQEVSGDFYWFSEKDNKIYIVAGDCTGHGVPASLISMLCFSLLDQYINKSISMDADEITFLLNEKIDTFLHQHKKESNFGGVDIAVAVIDKEKMNIHYCSASIPMFIARDGNFIESKPTKNGLGKPQGREDYKSYIEQLEKGDMIYFSSDGYYTQLGGPGNRTFQRNRLKLILKEIHKKETEKQKSIIENRLDSWRKISNTENEYYEQTDDIMVVGIRV